MIDTGAGVIDADYRGVVFVLLFNYSDKDFQSASGPSSLRTLAQSPIVEEGERIAQLILERIHTPDVLEVEARTKLGPTLTSSNRHSIGPR
jgi:dUTP pyrophosphatase